LGPVFYEVTVQALVVGENVGAVDEGRIGLSGKMLIC